MAPHTITPRLEAARELIAQGLVVVPYTAPARRDGRGGKAPLSDGVGGRAECHTLDEFERYLRRVPALNMAILGVLPTDVVSRRDAGTAPPMPPCGRP